MSDTVPELTEETFESEVLKSELPVLVDFWAYGCGPCLRVPPILEDLATEFEGKLKFGKINIDDYFDTVTDLGVSAVPTLILFKNGEEQERKTGVPSKLELKALLERNL